MKSRSILLMLLLIVFAVGVWQLTSKRDLLKPELLGEAWHNITGTESAGDVASASIDHGDASGNSESVEIEETGPPVAVPFPKIRAATAAEMFPFAPDVPLLETTVSLPKRRAPIVYVAYGTNSENKRTSESQWFREFLKWQIRSQKSTRTLLNVVPNTYMLGMYNRAFEPINYDRTYDEFLKDAQAQAADIFIHPVFDGTTSQPRVSVRFVDLNTSRSQEWDSTQEGLTSIHDIIVEAAVTAHKFAGSSDAEIDANDVRKGAPSDQTFAWFVSTPDDDKTFETALGIIKTDPEFSCIYSYELGTTTPLQLADLGVRQFPNDVRLQFTKALTFDDAQCTEPLMRFTSELMRRYPDNLYVYSRLGTRLSVIYPCTPPAKEIPPIYTVMMRQIGLVNDRYMDCCTLSWHHAYTIKNLGDYIRGSNTVDRVPQETWRQYSMLTDEAHGIMQGLVKKYPRNVSLLTAFMYFDTNAGASGFDEQQEFIEKVAAIDPRETEVENQVAMWHSIGYGSERDFFLIVDNAFKRHAGDAKATREIVQDLRMQISRQIGWDQMTHDEAYTTNNPYINRFLDGAKFVYDRGLNLGFETDWTYKSVMYAREQHDVLERWKETGQNSFVAYVEAKKAADAGDWARCLKYAQLARPHMQNDDEGHLCRYYEIKSLWKLKRYEESLAASRDGIWAFPQEQTFPYMYAIVALEYGKHLETAFDCAWRAVSLGTGNPGCNETFEKLRAKLDKPNHPALVAMADTGTEK